LVFEALNPERDERSELKVTSEWPTIWELSGLRSHGLSLMLLSTHP